VAYLFQFLRKVGWLTINWLIGFPFKGLLIFGGLGKGNYYLELGNQLFSTKFIPLLEF